MRPTHPRGQVLVEFALAIGVTMTLLYGIIDFGRAVFAYNVVSSGAQLGSRYALVRGSSCTSADCPASSDAIAAYVIGRSPGVDATLLTVNATWSPDPAAGCPVIANKTVAAYHDPGCLVSVQVNYSFRFALLPSVGIPMTTTSQTIISQ